MPGTKHDRERGRILRQRFKLKKFLSTKNTDDSLVHQDISHYAHVCRLLYILYFLKDAIF